MPSPPASLSGISPLSTAHCCTHTVPCRKKHMLSQIAVGGIRLVRLVSNRQIGSQPHFSSLPYCLFLSSCNGEHLPHSFCNCHVNSNRMRVYARAAQLSRPVVHDPMPGGCAWESGNEIENSTHEPRGAGFGMERRTQTKVLVTLLVRCVRRE